jgi:hypothetical protein
MVLNSGLQLIPASLCPPCVRVRELEESLRAEQAFSHDLLMKQVASAVDHFDRACARNHVAD